MPVQRRLIHKAMGVLTNYIKLYGTYERFTFEGGSRDAENAIIFRTQLAF